MMELWRVRMVVSHLIATTPGMPMAAAARVTWFIPAALRMHGAGADKLAVNAATVRAALAGWVNAMNRCCSMC